MNYLTDTVAVVYHLRRRSKLGAKCSRIFADADQGLHHVYVSAITLMEVLYLAEAKRITLPLGELVESIEGSNNYSIVAIDTAIVRVAQSIDDVPELHDRILVATAALLQVPILTPDRLISNSSKEL